MKTEYLNGEANGQATMPDMGDAARKLQARSAEETLGLDQGSGLPKAFLQAFIGTSLVLAVLTVGPYFYGKTKPQGDAKADKPAEKAELAPAPTPVEPAKTDVAKKATETPKDAAKTAAKKEKDLLDVLGESGTKKSDPKVNPLDKKEDDLLKDLK